MDYDPENAKKFKIQIKSMEDLKNRRLSELKKMSYSDMQAAKKAVRDAGIAKAKEVGAVALRLSPLAFMVAGSVASHNILSGSGASSGWNKTMPDPQKLGPMNILEIKAWEPEGSRFINQTIRPYYTDPDILKSIEQAAQGSNGVSWYDFIDKYNRDRGG